MVGGRGRAFGRWFTLRPQWQESTRPSEKKVNNSGWPVKGMRGWYVGEVRREQSRSCRVPGTSNKEQKQAQGHHGAIKTG